MIDVAQNKKLLKKFTFIDLFAGIGGFHYAFKSFGAKCVFASEIDEHSAAIYLQNHQLKPAGDITKIDEKDIPTHDILCGGFPCQAFSISGKRKGFEDTRGTLFFDIARIVKQHKPKILLLENVKNFVSHNQGDSLATVINTLEELNYQVHYQVLNTSQFGLAQNRARLYIVAFNKKHFSNISFRFPDKNIATKLEHFLEKEPKDGKIVTRKDICFYKDYKAKFDKKGKEILPNKPIQIAKINKGGQGERVYHSAGHAITLSAFGGGIGSRTGLYQVGDTIRKLSPRECARLQGFPESFVFSTRTAQAQKQFGNSVSIDVLQYIIEEIIESCFLKK